MQKLTTEGQRVVRGLAERHGFSEEAAMHMLFAVLHGNGAMAQFNHPEFAGSGQWMRGGMLMLGDMFNYSLKARVDALCSEIAGVLADQPGLLQWGSFQSQSQSGGGQQQTAGGTAGQSSLFVPDPSVSWWPRDLGPPSATGSQNNVQYAYFAQARRLAVKVTSGVRVYDTLDHHIGGFSQQQGAGGTILFTSQHGVVDLNTLRVVSIDGRPASQQAEERQDTATASKPGSGSVAAGEDVFAAIERLGKLHTDGLLTEDEFTKKKAELLQRI